MTLGGLLLRYFASKVVEKSEDVLPEKSGARGAVAVNLLDELEARLESTDSDSFDLRIASCSCSSSFIESSLD